MKIKFITLALALTNLGSLAYAEDPAATANSSVKIHETVIEQAANFSQEADVKAFIDELVTQDGFDRADLEHVFDAVELKPRILDVMDRPTTSHPYYEFRPNFVNAKRIRAGVAWWKAHASTIKAVSEQYKVDPEYLVTILGIETMWGQDTGSFRVIDALSTLAFRYPRRAEFFRKELREFLLLAREEGVDALNFKGSYAGAMGMPQFMPSSFRAYAQTWGGDNHRDIWHNEGDTLASIANYFAQHGWQMGGPLVVPAAVTGNNFAPLVDDKFNLHYKASELAQYGVTPVTPLSDDPLAVFVPLETKDGKTDYWLGFNNFNVITQYNHSTLYAMAAYELAQAIKAAYLDPAKLPAEPVAPKKKHRKSN